MIKQMTFFVSAEVYNQLSQNLAAYRERHKLDNNTEAFVHLVRTKAVAASTGKTKGKSQ